MNGSLNFNPYSFRKSRISAFGNVLNQVHSGDNYFAVSMIQDSVQRLVSPRPLSHFAVVSHSRLMSFPRFENRNRYLRVFRLFPVKFRNGQ